MLSLYGYRKDGHTDRQLWREDQELLLIYGRPINRTSSEFHRQTKIKKTRFFKTINIYSVTTPNIRTAAAAARDNGRYGRWSID